jgi:hypothetical protein
LNTFDNFEKDAPFVYVGILEEICYNTLNSIFCRYVDDWEVSPIYMRPRPRDMIL